MELIKVGIPNHRPCNGPLSARPCRDDFPAYWPPARRGRTRESEGARTSAAVRPAERIHPNSLVRALASVCHRDAERTSPPGPFCG